MPLSSQLSHAGGLSARPFTDHDASDRGAACSARWGRAWYNAPCRARPPPAVLDAYLDGKPKALILECYGAGTLPSLDGRMQPFLQQLVGDGTIVVALSQVAHGGLSIDTYASGSALVAAGIVDGRDMTFEAAFTKLHHLLARGGDPQSIRDAMMRDISGEMSLEPETGTRTTARFTPEPARFGFRRRNGLKVIAIMKAPRPNAQEPI